LFGFAVLAFGIGRQEAERFLAVLRCAADPFGQVSAQLSLDGSIFRLAREVDQFLGVVLPVEKEVGGSFAEIALGMARGGIDPGSELVTFGDDGCLRPILGDGKGATGGLAGDERWDQ